MTHSLHKLIFLAAFFLGIWSSAAASEKIAISSMEKIELGQIPQTIFIHTHDASKPVLLFLHGGPGYSEIPYAGWFEQGLEDRFVIVHWDQRGAGLSYSPTISPASMTIAQFVADTRDLTLYLRKRFSKEKIYLVGHSWGTIVGTMAVQKYPELYEAYVGIGQVVDVARSERIAYDYTLDEAKKRKNLFALQELTRTAPPPAYGGSLQDLDTQRKWLLQFGGSFFDLEVDLRAAKTYLASPAYGAMDPQTLQESIRFSISSLAPEILRVNFLETAPELKVPVYFFCGRHDYTTYYGLVEEYFAKVKAPHKELLWFEKSGHHPHLEEPQKFVEAIIDKLGHSSTTH